MEEMINPKALNLDALKTSRNKVTLGFKCAPEIKLILSQEATQLGITLSEYVENLVLNRQKLNSEAEAKINELKEVIKDQKELIQFYENDYLNDLFNKYKGKSADFINPENKKIELKINTIKDVYTIIINSFKISKK